VVDIFKIEIEVMIIMKIVCNDHKILMGIVVDFMEDVVVAFKIVGIKEKVEISDDEVVSVIAVAVNADV
jgi:hypothetical protein